MNTHFDIIKDSFVDYAGKTHHFIIAAVSKDLTHVAMDINHLDQTNAIPKGVSLGISICNPEDKFDEQIGVCKAVGRADNAEISLYATNKGYINTTLVRAFLQQEAEYLKNNPEKYIAGYWEAKERYLKKKSMEELKDNFSSTEKIIVEEVQKNPEFLTNVNTYLTWLKNQERGKKCKKSGK